MIVVTLGARRILAKLTGVRRNKKENRRSDFGKEVTLVAGSYVEGSVVFRLVTGNFANT
jgi:hypothetical protein